jgi:hypothetical protein
MDDQAIANGMDLRKARQMWKKLGGSVEKVNRTGEERFHHPEVDRAITVNARKRVSPRVLVVNLRKLYETHSEN